MPGDSATQELLQLAEAWRNAQPLSEETDRRLWQKLRLNWNYHSNHIEGNTLTYGETELLLLHGQTHGSHQLREYEEMKAHDVAISRLRELAAEKRPLTEAEIRTWNGIILKEPFWKNARTPDGEPTRKQIIPGQYKAHPNSVLTATGQMFEFVSPMDVPARMSELVSRLNDTFACPLRALPPELAKTHHAFSIIHPFDDGNGRVARLILNYILLRRGLVPIVIPTEEKKTYLGALREADAGYFESLTRYIVERMTAALEEGLQSAGASPDSKG